MIKDSHERKEESCLPYLRSNKSVGTQVSLGVVDKRDTISCSPDRKLVDRSNSLVSKKSSTCANAESAMRRCDET